MRTKRLIVLRKNKLIQVSLAFAAVIIVSFEIYQLYKISINMRPVADDYCLAGSATLTPIGYFNYWYTTFIADFSTLFGNYILIALPAVFLPYGIGTSVTFFFCLISLSVVIYKFLNPAIDGLRKKIIFSTGVFFFAYLSWITYWLVLGRGNSGDIISRGDAGDMVFFGAIMNWHAANVNYVVLPFIALLIYSKLFTGKIQTWNPLIPLLLGFIVGGSFYVLSTVFIFLIAVQIIFTYLTNVEKSVRDFKNEAFVLIAAITSISLSYFSPGAKLRRVNYAQDVPLISIPKTAIEGMFTWASTLYLPAIIITLLLGAVLYRALFATKAIEFRMDVANFVIVPFILSFITFVVTKVSELFAYKAWWHELSSRTFLFISVFTFGMYLMEILINRFNLKFTFLEMTVLATVIFIGIYSVKQSGDAIVERQVRWEVGPAQVTTNMDPFDRETAWVNACWIQLEERRNSR
jgi:hypothetical protein